MGCLQERIKKHVNMLGRKKCVFQVTWNFKIGTVGRIFFFQTFYMGMIVKQYVQTGKSCGIPKKSLKKVMVGGKKLGIVQ